VRPRRDHRRADLAARPAARVVRAAAGAAIRAAAAGLADSAAPEDLVAEAARACR